MRRIRTEPYLGALHAHQAAVACMHLHSTKAKVHISDFLFYFSVVTKPRISCMAGTRSSGPRAQEQIQTHMAGTGLTSNKLEIEKEPAISCRLSEATQREECIRGL